LSRCRLPRILGRERAPEPAEFICGLPQPAFHTEKEPVLREFGLAPADGLRIKAECFNPKNEVAPWRGNDTLEQKAKGRAFGPEALSRIRGGG